MSQSYHRLSEQELLRLYAKKGELDYLGVALQRYTAVLLGVGFKYVQDLTTAQDLVQQVFLKALEKPPKEMTNLGGWLYRVMKNECMDYLKKSKFNFVEEWEEAGEELLTEKEHWEQSIREEKMMTLLDTLKPEQAMALRLFYLDGKSYQEIAAQTGWDLKEVKTHIQNGKRNLKIKFENSINS